MTTTSQSKPQPGDQPADAQPVVAQSGPRGTVLTDAESFELLAEYDWDV